MRDEGRYKRRIGQHEVPAETSKGATGASHSDRGSMRKRLLIQRA